MKCCGVRDRLSEYVDREIDERTLELIEAHIADCPECRKELAALQSLTAAARSTMVEPPASLRASIAAATTGGRPELCCEPVRGRLSAYLDGELRPAEQREVDSHTAGCRACATELAALRSIVIAAADCDPVEPPADLRARIAAATAQRRKAAANPWWAAGVLRRFGWAGAAAAAGVAAVVLLSSPQVPRESPQVAVVKPEASATAAAVADEQPTAGPEIAVSAAPVVRVATGPAHSVARRSVERLSVEAKPQPAAAKPSAPRAPAAPKPEAVAPRPEMEPESVAEVEEPQVDEPVEVAIAPDPAPEIVSSRRTSDKPTLIKVTRAPAVDQPKRDTWTEELEAKMAARESSRRATGLVMARF